MWQEAESTFRAAPKFHRPTIMGMMIIRSSFVILFGLLVSTIKRPRGRVSTVRCKGPSAAKTRKNIGGYDVSSKPVQGQRTYPCLKHWRNLPWQVPTSWEGFSMRQAWKNGTAGMAKKMLRIGGLSYACPVPSADSFVWRATPTLYSGLVQLTCTSCTRRTPPYLINEFRKHNRPALFCTSAGK